MNKTNEDAARATTVEDLIDTARRRLKTSDLYRASAYAETAAGKIVCEVSTAHSRTTPNRWGRTTFYIVRPGEKRRTKFSKAKAVAALTTS